MFLGGRWRERQMSQMYQQNWEWFTDLIDQLLLFDSWRPSPYISQAYNIANGMKENTCLFRPPWAGGRHQVIRNYGSWNLNSAERAESFNSIGLTNLRFFLLTQNINFYINGHSAHTSNIKEPTGPYDWKLAPKLVVCLVTRINRTTIS